MKHRQCAYSSLAAFPRVCGRAPLVPKLNPMRRSGRHAATFVASGQAVQ